MKKFILKVAIFFAIIATVDAVCGFVFPYIFYHAKGGNNQRSVYICDLSHEDMLVFGSSRAIHHYNPAILEDSLGISCYNCGQNGNGIILNYGRLQLLMQRYTPKVIIYDVVRSFDLALNDNHKYLGYLKPFYDREGIPQIFEDVDSTEKWKMMSQMYRYNSKIFSCLSDYLHPLHSDYKGFRPINQEMDTMKINKIVTEKEKLEFDPLKLQYLRKLVDMTNGVKLIFAVSPMWYGTDSIDYTPIREICQQHDIPFLDFSNNPKYVHNNLYFKDGSHLNARGADEFTRDMIVELKKVLEE